MRLRFFTVPLFDNEEVTEELKRFLAEQRVLSIGRELVRHQETSYWAIAVSYKSRSGTRTATKVGKLDYREVLSEADFACFAALRSIRKSLAEAEGVPAYHVFTNEQLAEIAKQRCVSVTALKEVPGVGAARAEKYGAAIFEEMREYLTKSTLGSESGGIA